MATKTRKSRQDYQDERTALRARLEEWKANGFDPTLAAYVAMSQVYSERNAMLIVMQCPDATEVRGYRAWQALGRQVKRGEVGIRILAPAGHRDAEKPTETNPKGTDEQWFFRLISVFDLAQTMTAEEAAAEQAATDANTTESTPVPAGV